ncbi:methylated-DNA--[protein]-cysteine S-methyltransferase [Microbacterium sp.]|uniref:methylated-DNA--[protein]-cysteine S-methyltransferase n=1 Tax=Microbacterium sp. TaxID=51671 RepID=UPI003A87E0AD
MTPTFWSTHPTPVGDALIVVSDRGLVALEVGDQRDALARWATQLGVPPESDPDAVAPVARQLDEYFAAQRTDFDLAIDWRSTGGFVRRALQAVCTIDYGETASYGEVAILAGSPGAHRAAGSACARTPISIIVPAHRVVRSDGSLGGYGGRPEVKRFLLDLEAPHSPVRTDGV